MYNGSVTDFPVSLHDQLREESGNETPFSSFCVSETGRGKLGAEMTEKWLNLPLFLF